MKKKLIIGGLILVLAVGYLGFMGFRSSASYYYSVNQLLDKGSSIYNKTVRLNGDVAPGSIEQKAGDLNLKFAVSEGGKTLPVVYRGAVPDTFQEGNPVVVEGSLDAAGVFQAKSLMVKCPSKYEPTVAAPVTNGIN
ncbi:MAG: cytochrome c maturation protein CcmE [Dehalococcoidales bacterium]|nr:cytochrome c maturation protein CcmE [Dehalococcoidales bacterium]